MTGVDVHGNVGQIELLERICYTFSVSGSRVFAGLEVAVGDEIGQRVRLDDQCNGRIGVLLEYSNNGCIPSD